MAKNSRKLWAEHLAGRSSKSTKIDPKSLLLKSPYRGKILGIDPSLRGTGLAILECEGNSRKLLHSETLTLKTKIDSIACLGLIHQAVAHLIDLWKPRHVSCEATIYVQNFKTAQIMGAARGAALSASAIGEVPVFEYAPLRVKQAVVGFGRASKEQMSQTLSQMLRLPNPLPFDQSDALGLALCHALTWQPTE
ncbi:MAG: crossover junction endodeoxyribonuclease RuvC [Opitutae bacterium]|jgi:crossover junction endodeoxyribonuclease RuvC|nr:crossover junction endodeoxyribonuclease RuvC [Opitutae bacterium]MBT5716881.1 crossover junction endodeoxyribonuclease RuvC [Opitutae bacterium]